VTTILDGPNPLRVNGKANGNGDRIPEATAAPMWPRREVLTACQEALRQVGRPAQRSIGVTSCTRGEGRTTVASALALVESHYNRRRTILIELDVERPCLARLLDLNEAPGVTEFVAGEAPFALQWHRSGMGVVVGGSPQSPDGDWPERLLSSDILARLESLADVVVADLPPLDEPAGFIARNPWETTFLVVRAGTSTLDQVHHSVSVLPAEPAVIMNGTRSLPTWYRALTGH
jgi:protein-tyrosine kinase